MLGSLSRPRGPALFLAVLLWAAPLMRGQEFPEADRALAAAGAQIAAEQARFTGDRHPEDRE